MRKYVFLNIILFPLFFSNANSQITFQKTFGGDSGEVGKSVQQTTDEGYIIAGYTLSFGAGDKDVYLIKTDSMGNILWSKTYGGLNIDIGYSVKQTIDLGYIIVGETQSYGIGNKDIYLIKTDTNGDTLWTRTYGGSSDDIAYSIQQTSDSGYIFVGETYSFGAGNSDVYLIRTNINGDTLWTKTYGEVSWEEAFSVSETFGNDKGYIITGRTSSFGGGSYDIYLIKTDVVGNILWSKTFGGANTDAGYSVQHTSDGGYIIVGIMNYMFEGFPDVYLIKTDSIGNDLWLKMFSFGTVYDYGYSVLQTYDGGYIITGYSGSLYKVYLIKTDSIGNILWTKTFGGGVDEGGYSVKQTSDGGYIITGETYSFGEGNADVYLIKTDANGNSIRCFEDTTIPIVSIPVTVIDTTSTVIGSGVTITNPITTVINANTVVNDLTSLVLTAFSLPDTAGTGKGMAWVIVSGGTPVFTYLWDDPALQTSDTAYNLIAGIYNVVVTDYNGCKDSSSITVDNVTGIRDYERDHIVQIYPNPNNGTFILKYSIQDIQSVEFIIFDIIGSKLKAYQLKGGMKKFNIANKELKNGLYFYQVIVNNRVILTDKLIVIK